MTGQVKWQWIVNVCECLEYNAFYYIVFVVCIGDYFSVEYQINFLMMRFKLCIHLNLFYLHMNCSFICYQ